VLTLYRGGACHTVFRYNTATVDENVVSRSPEAAYMDADVSLPLSKYEFLYQEGEPITGPYSFNILPSAKRGLGFNSEVLT
jgi:hypothetical protein